MILSYALWSYVVQGDWIHANMAILLNTDVTTAASLVTALVAIVYLSILGSVAWDRLSYLTTTPATMPIGTVRKVTCRTPEQAAGMGRYRDMMWLVMSYFIVPYESTVIFVDELYSKDSGDTPKANPGYCLTPQERVHSGVHVIYNNRFEANLTSPVNKYALRFVKSFFKVSTNIMARFIPTVVCTIVCIHENKFYYDQSVPELFELFRTIGQRFPVMAKIYLWHLFEELEHHMEAVQLYRSTFGWKIWVLIPVVAPIYSVLMYVLFTFGFILSLLNFEAAQFLPNLYEWLYDLLYMDITIVWSCLLILCGLSSKDSKLQEDLQTYRHLFITDYKIDLQADKTTGGPSSPIVL